MGRARAGMASGEMTSASLCVFGLWTVRVRERWERCRSDARWGLHSHAVERVAGGAHREGEPASVSVVFVGRLPTPCALVTISPAVKTVVTNRNTLNSATFRQHSLHLRHNLTHTMASASFILLMHSSGPWLNFLSPSTHRHKDKRECSFDSHSFFF